MNSLPIATRVAILEDACAGYSLRAIASVRGVSKGAVQRTLVEAERLTRRFPFATACVMARADRLALLAFYQGYCGAPPTEAMQRGCITRPLTLTNLATWLTPSSRTSSIGLAALEKVGTRLRNRLRAQQEAEAVAAVEAARPWILLPHTQPIRGEPVGRVQPPGPTPLRRCESCNQLTTVTPCLHCHAPLAWAVGPA